ncbi:MAG TPA: hypothetical protein VEH50_14030 [Methylomirabilota bacterium]|nr:hypothetical protein [Methylomirabilota bacterium]
MSQTEKVVLLVAGCAVVIFLFGVILSFFEDWLGNRVPAVPAWFRRHPVLTGFLLVSAFYLAFGRHELEITPTIGFVAGLTFVGAGALEMEVARIRENLERLESRMGMGDTVQIPRIIDGLWETIHELRNAHQQLESRVVADRRETVSEVFGLTERVGELETSGRHLEHRTGTNETHIALLLGQKK